MPLTPQEVAAKVFGPTRMRRGYDENEVDAFLDQVEAELTRLTTENERLRRELLAARGGGGAPAAAAEAMPVTQPTAAVEGAGAVPTERAEPPGSEVAAVATVAATDVSSSQQGNEVVEQRVARMLVLAQQTADAAIREAQTEAERMRGSARTEAERIVNEARGRAATEIGNLERSKHALETQVEQLHGFEREYRQRLRAYLEMQLRDLEGSRAAMAVEGGRGAELGAGSAPEIPDGNGGGSQFGGQHSASADPLSAGFSDPPGFGPVWSPDSAGQSAGQGAGQGAAGARAAGAGENETGGGGSPFDTGGEGHRNGGYGAP